MGKSGSIAYPLVGLIVLISLATAAAGYFQTLRSQSQSLAQSSEQGVRHTAAVVETLIRAEVPRLGALARSLSENGELAAALARASADAGDQTLATVLDRISKYSAVDLLQVSNRGQMVLYRAHDPERKGDTPNIWGVDEALAGEHVVVTSAGPAGLALRAISPVRSANGIAGTVMVGSVFDDGFAKRLARQAGADIHFASPRGVWAGSRRAAGLAQQFRAPLEAILQHKSAVFVDDPASQRVRLFAPFRIVDESFTLVVELDTSAAHAVHARAVREQVTVSLTILAVAVLLGLILTWRIIRPLARLRRDAQAIAGRFSTQTADVGGGNEIESLARVFKAATGALEDAHRLASESEHAVRAMLESMPLMVAVLNSNLDFEYANRRYEEWAGAGPASVVGRSAREIMGDEYYGLAEPSMRAALGGQPGIMERVKRLADGTERHVLGHHVPRVGADGRVDGVYLVLLDITERKAGEAAFKASEVWAKRLAMVASRTNNAVMIADASGRVDWVNEGFVRLTGYAAEEARGRTIAQLLHGPATAPETVQMIRQRINAGEGMQGEILHYAKGGRPYWAALDIQPEKDAGGAVTHVLSLQWDITERKAAEAALKASEARAKRLALVASRTHNVVIISDAHGRIEWVNDAFVELTGYTQDEVLGKSPGGFLQGPQTDRAEAARIGQLVRAGASFKSEILNYSKSGRKYWLAIDAQALRDAEGRLTNFIAIESDITERKAAERALQEAKEAAEAASRAKSEFVANMSHEIRTPMNGVLGMTELLLDTGLDEGQRRYARNIRNSADSLLNIINDILDFSKIEAGKMELDPVDFDVRELVEEVAEMAAGRAHAKGIELLCGVDAAVPAAARGDAGRLRQVLTNLVGNAVKFTERGEVRIEVRPAGADGGALAAPDGGGCRLEFAITDTGIGITDEAIRRLFSAFTQADGSTTRRFGGTGLGLAISRQLVELMGGAIEVESMPDHGSRFCFSLALDPAESAGTDWIARDDLRGLDVLIVEDNQSNGEILLQHASTWKMRATLAPDAETALAAVAAAGRAGQRFDLALIDWKLPGMNGIDLAGALRQAGPGAPQRMVLLTSMTASNVAQIAKTAGFAAYLNKPLRRVELYRTISRVMGIAATVPEDVVVAASGPRTGGQVLLVEDNLVNQDIGAAMLGAAGLRVDVANNGIEAVALFGRKRYDLILMDCQMPEMDGFAATAEIRMREAATGVARTPIVALTANAMQGDRERCLAAGMDDYLAKPFSKPQLAAMVLRWNKNPVAAGGDPSAATGSGAAAIAGVALAVTAEDAVPTLDQSALANIRALERPGTPSLLGRVVERYVTDAARLYGQMQTALAGCDAAALARAAHTLKSASANVGAHRPAALCKALETGARAGDLAGCAPLLEQLQPQLEQVGDALRVEIEMTA